MILEKHIFIVDYFVRRIPDFSEFLLIRTVKVDRTSVSNGNTKGAARVSMYYALSVLASLSLAIFGSSLPLLGVLLL